MSTEEMIQKREKATLFSKGEGRESSNKTISIRNIEEAVFLSKEGRDALLLLSKKGNLSPRVYHKILRVGRSIADLDESKEVQKGHILEAFQYRQTFFS